MPPLLEIQRAMARAILTGEACDLASEERIAVYRGTFQATLTRALRLTYPAVHKLVGEEFFAGATALYAAESPPRSSWLDLYGDGFPDFLARLPQAQGVPYLAGVARLEWAVNRVLHAEDAGHPPFAEVRADHPVDAIWRAVLVGDDDDLAALDVDAGPVALKVWRSDDGIEVERRNENGSQP
jgi:hypothetical protein